MSSMARLQYGRLTEAWTGEASDFTPLLAAQLDIIGSAIGVDLVSIGEAEVATTGGRRIDIVAQGEDGSEFVVENQYGRADHDHLTRGLAYAVAHRARGLIVVAEEHRGEFRAVADYLNELAEHDPERGIAVWLVEAKAVRIENSPWAPLFTVVAKPNAFTKTVEQAKRSQLPMPSIDEIWAQFDSPTALDAAQQVVERWLAMGHRRQLGPTYVRLEAAGPSTSGFRAVVRIYSNGQIAVPFGAYTGKNSGIPIPSLINPEFRSAAEALFGLGGSDQWNRSAPGWLTPERVDVLLKFCTDVAAAYADALSESATDLV
jgi:hypothetical protein